MQRTLDCFASLAMTMRLRADERTLRVHMASRRNGTLYIGVTSDLIKRAYEHREGLVSGFTKRYGCKILVWYEMHETMTSAIEREKQLKAGSRKKKLELIEVLNPGWTDLYASLF